MIILVCGGRDFNSDRHRKIIFDVLGELDPTHLVTGCATGADLHARSYIRHKSLEGSVFEADWKTYGKAAGPKRNQEMIDYVKNHPKYKDEDKLVVSFWDGRSKGTMNTMSLANKAGLRVIYFDMQVQAIGRLQLTHYQSILQEFIDLHKEDIYFDLRFGQWMLTHDILKVDSEELYTYIFNAERISRVARLLIENDILEI